MRNDRATVKKKMLFGLENKIGKITAIMYIYSAINIIFFYLGLGNVETPLRELMFGGGKSF